MKYPGIIAAAQVANLAFPQVASLLTQGFPTAATTHNVTMPSTVNGGDLLIIFMTSWIAAHSVTTPAGWTAKYNQNFTNSTFASAAVFVKFASGTEGGTSVNLASSANVTMATQVYRITNWFGSLTGVQSAALTADTATDLSETPPPITASWGALSNLFIIVIHGVDDDETLATHSTGFTNPTSAISGGGVNAGPATLTARRELAGASVTPTACTVTSVVSSTERLCSSTLVIRPAA